MLILVIDDSRFLQLGIQKALQQVGHDTLLASDGDQAINMAIEKHPDLILLDIMLPGVPGTTVLRILKQNPVTSAIPVIVLTGLSRLDGAKLKKEGADGYLKKSELELQDGGQTLLRLVNQLAPMPRAGSTN